MGNGGGDGVAVTIGRGRLGPLCWRVRVTGPGTEGDGTGFVTVAVTLRRITGLRFDAEGRWPPGGREGTGGGAGLSHSLSELDILLHWIFFSFSSAGCVAGSTSDVEAESSTFFVDSTPSGINFWVVIGLTRSLRGTVFDESWTIRVPKFEGDSVMSADFGVATKFVPCCSDSFFEFGNLEMIAIPFGVGVVGGFSWTKSGVTDRFGCVIGWASWDFGCGESTPWSRLRTLARGGPGGSSMTVTTLTLSARRLHMFHRWMERSTNFLDGLIQVWPPLGSIMWRSLLRSVSNTDWTAIPGERTFQRPSVARMRHLSFKTLRSMTWRSGSGLTTKTSSLEL